MGKCDWVTWSGSRKFFGAAGGSFMILMSVLTIIGIFSSNMYTVPEGWMAIVASVWMGVFGMTVVLLQIEGTEEPLIRQAAFLGTRCGRGFYYLFCGNFGGAGVALNENAPLWIKAFGWTTFFMLWTLGFTEFCDMKPRAKTGGNRLEDERNPNQVTVQTGR